MKFLLPENVSTFAASGSRGLPPTHPVDDGLMMGIFLALGVLNVILIAVLAYRALRDGY